MADEKQQEKIKNNVKIEEVGPCKKKVVIEIPEEAVKAATDEQYGELGKDSVVPGFRKGRAPRRLLEKRFGKEVSQQIKLKLLSESSEEALKDCEFESLGEPDIDYENIELPDEGALKYDVPASLGGDDNAETLDIIQTHSPDLGGIDYIYGNADLISAPYGAATRTAPFASASSSARNSRPRRRTSSLPPWAVLTGQVPMV